MFIVIEWIDGSGKWTQTELVKKELENEWFKVWALDFPQYERESSYFVKQYLNWKYWKSVDAKVASLFYALDRFDAKKDIEKTIEENDFVISNRYMTSNLTHQGWKKWFVDKKLIEYLEDLEYNTFWIPKPDKVLFLDIDPDTAKILIKKKEQRDYIEDWKNEDIHEEDSEHLKNAFSVWEFLCSERDWQMISCFNDNKKSINTLLSKKNITNAIIEAIAS